MMRSFENKQSIGQLIRSYYFTSGVGDRDVRSSGTTPIVQWTNGRLKRARRASADYLLYAFRLRLSQSEPVLSGHHDRGLRGTYHRTRVGRLLSIGCIAVP